ncbi:RIP metalloprotease RseP [Aquabacterium sp. A3]|uniref:RIP metalloprotease RseP n=1 Tax=Aquabacterium sp. A3 TaxID=3132829 RepID=UPI00311A5843
MLMTVLAFLVTIGVLVVIHEYGHYRAAVACDVKVHRFSVGFGQVIWSRMRGETEFVISALPLGGYVKMLDEREGPVAPSEQHRAFNRKPVRQRAFIVAAGPAANLLLAVVLYAAVNWVGVPELSPWMAQPQPGSMADEAGLQAGQQVLAARTLQQAEDAEDWTPVRSMSDLQWLITEAALAGHDLELEVGRRDRVDQEPHSPVSLRLPLSRLSASDVDAGLLDRVGLTGPYGEPLIDEVVSGGPAQRAGLQAGDRVIRINGQTPRDAGELRGVIRASLADGQPQPIMLDIERGGRLMQFTLEPVLKDVQGQMIPRIEAAIGSAPAMITVRYGLWEGLERAVTRTWDVSVLSLQMLGKMLIGEASLKNLSGPLTIADYAGRTAEMGWVHYIGFLALVSVSLGVLNLLPLPVLDGGHLMYHLFEAVTGRPVSDLWLERLQRGGLAIMLLMMSLALYNDFARLFGVH